jgi:hypothetical protein
VTAPTELQRLARRALLTRAKATGALTALVPAPSIAPDAEVPWPKISIEAPRALPLRSACVRGASVAFDVHAFAGPREVAQQVVETGYDHASRIGAAIETAFADNRITLEDGAVCKIEFSDANLLRDGEPDAWHWFGQLNCRVLAEAV